jgi:hypothetical protein
MRVSGCACAVVLLSAAAGAAGQGDARSLADTLALTGRRVEGYYARARTLVATERVLIQPVGSDLLPDGQGRRLTYELRVEWEPPAQGEAAGHARVVRQLLSVNGRTPNPANDPGCIDPIAVSPEPLAIFLPATRPKYEFTYAGLESEDGRAAVIVDYREANPASPDVTWKGECVTINVPERTLGRAWIDSATGDVLRLDERFDGRFDFPVPWEHQRHGSPSLMTIERNDTSIRYRQVTFADPAETLLLPVQVDTVSIVRNAGSPRVRVTQTFSDYRRFTTDSRIIK